MWWASDRLDGTSPPSDRDCGISSWDRLQHGGYQITTKGGDATDYIVSFSVDADLLQYGEDGDDLVVGTPNDRASGGDGDDHVYGGTITSFQSLLGGCGTDLVASRCNPVLEELYQRLIAKGKPVKVALAAVARKLLTVLNAMARD